MSQNCWEFKRCGRAEGGHNVKDMGVCPAYTERRLNGVHGGHNSGRACWAVAGTFCKGEKQGSFAMKYKACTQCDFYAAVKKEEGAGFQMSGALLSKLK